MKEQTKINGYVLTDSERTARKVAKFIGIPMLLLILIFLFSDTIKNDNSVLFEFCLWLIIDVFSIISFYSYQIIDDMQFFITDDKLINASKAKNENSIVLSDQFYVTTLSLEFGYGKSTQIRVFYLFSYQSFSINDLRGSGLRTLKYLTRNGIVIIPKNKEADEWIQNELKIGSIPEFPASVVRNQKNQLINENQLWNGMIDG